jgi:alanine-synthesizing transaminase
LEIEMFAKRTSWEMEPNRLTRALAARRAAGVPVLDLAESNPTRCGFDYDSAAILRALSNPAALTYHPDPRGLLSAREAVAKYYAARAVRITPDDIFLTASTSEGYTYALRLLCNPGDSILVPTPSYPLFDYLAGIQDVEVARYRLFYDHGWQIDFHALEAAVTERTRAIVVVHPNNPTGHYARREEMRKLAEICAANHLALIADEVFFDFAFPNQKTALSSGSESPAAAAQSFAAESPALTLVLNGLSKSCGLPQMKVAWMCVGGPEQLRRNAAERLEVIADTYLSLATPAQLAVPTLLETRHAFHKQVMARVAANLDELNRQLGGAKSCTRLEVEGGWTVVLRVPATRSDEDLALALVEKQGVYVHPGHFYDFPGDGYLVASLIVQQGDFIPGMARLLELVCAYAQH